MNGEPISMTAATPSSANVDPAELAKFAALAHRWWDPTGEFKPLHEINPLRLGWIEQIVGDFRDRRDPAIDGEHESTALVGEAAECDARDAVAFVEATRQMPFDVGAQLA